MSGILNLSLTESEAIDVLAALHTEYGIMLQKIISPEYQELKNTPKYDDYKWHEERADNLKKIIKTINQWQDES